MYTLKQSFWKFNLKKNPPPKKKQKKQKQIKNKIKKNLTIVVIHILLVTNLEGGKIERERKREH